MISGPNYSYYGTLTLKIQYLSQL